MKIKLTSVYVDDQEWALRFYTEVLGFTKKADFGNGLFRWLTVASPDEPDGTELQLALNDNPAAKAWQQAMAGETSKKPVKAARTAAAKRVAAEPVLLSGGNPQIAKADGDAPVQAYIAAMPDWKRDIGKRLDALMVRNVPNVRKAVKWNSPFYGIEREGWFLSFHVFTHSVKVTFFRGTSLRPVPPGASKHNEVRYFDIHECDELDEAQMANWVKQAAALPGWVP
jgi:hypothetical protein